jgi:hypothetical protein
MVSEYYFLALAVTFAICLGRYLATAGKERRTMRSTRGVSASARARRMGSVNLVATHATAKLPCLGFSSSTSIPNNFAAPVFSNCQPESPYTTHNTAHSTPAACETVDRSDQRRSAQMSASM